MIKLSLATLSLLAAMMACPVASFADDEAPAGEAGAGGAKPNIVYRKKTSVNFDEAVVESNTDNPEGVYVVTPPGKEFGSLLKLRPNFHRELIRDSLLLK